MFGLSFLDSVSFADQKVETTQVSLPWQRHLLKAAGILCQGGDTTTCWDLGFLDSVPLADQKAETTPHPNLGVRFYGLSVTC